MKTTQVNRTASWYRPYEIEGKKIDRIILYRKGEILYTSRSGWLEHKGGGE